MCVERYISLPSLHSRALTHSLELLQPQAHKIHNRKQLPPQRLNRCLNHTTYEYTLANWPEKN